MEIHGLVMLVNFLLIWTKKQATVYLKTGEKMDTVLKGGTPVCIWKLTDFNGINFLLN